MFLSRGLRWIWVISLFVGFMWLEVSGLARTAFLMASMVISLIIFRRFVRRNILWLWIPLGPILWILGTGLILPSATLHYPSRAKKELNHIWNVQHRIYREALVPGQSSTDYGVLFPNDDFFMRVDWWGGTANGCAVITPTWKGTNIYLDENGDFDRSEGNLTDWQHLAPCPEGDSVSP